MDLEQLLSNMPGIVYWLDPNLKYQGCNDHFAKTTGLECRTHIVGKSHHDLLSPKYAERLNITHLDILKTGTALSIEEEIEFSNGKKSIFVSKKAPLRDSNGNTTGLLVISFDITTQKETERKLLLALKKAQKVDQLKSEFLEIIRNDIRHPSAQMIGFKNLLNKDPNPIMENSYLNDMISAIDELPTTPSRVLLIEDQSLAGEITKIVLSDLNCQVDIAIDSKTALQLSQNQKYDLVFMDIGLPDVDGYETTKRIRVSPSQNQRVPIIALTAHVDYQDRQRCIDSGMNAILIKPLIKETALEILHAFIPKIEDSKIPIAANDETDWSKLPGKIIDLELGAQFFNGNVELAKKMIKTMITNIAGELEDLDKAYKTKNWEVLQSIVHKLRGDVSYCGTPRLQEAFGRLENHLTAGYSELAPLLYKQLLKEIETVKNEQILRDGDV